MFTNFVEFCLTEKTHIYYSHPCRLGSNCKVGEINEVSNLGDAYPEWMAYGHHGQPHHGWKTTICVHVQVGKDRLVVFHGTFWDGSSGQVCWHFLD